MVFNNLPPDFFKQLDKRRMIKAQKLLFLLLLAWGTCASSAFANSIYDIRLSGGLEKTRLVIEFENQVAFQVYNINDPDRLIIDIDAVEFKLPQNIGAKPYGLVKQFRYGNFSLKKSRIVLDTVSRTEVVAAFTVPKKANKGALLVVDIVKRTQQIDDRDNVKRDGKQNLSVALKTKDDDLSADQELVELDFQPDIPSLDELLSISKLDVADIDDNDLAQSKLPQAKVDTAVLEADTCCFKRKN